MMFGRHLALLFFVSMIVFGFLFTGCGGGTADEPNASASDEHAAMPAIKAAEEENKPVTGEDGKAPKLVFKEVAHDFGKQISGKDLVHSFVFTNDGDGTLIIENVKAG
ncbi:DUF1573 domain-containing protein [bacterium]|nr:DUF1573 domain-containing protein [candidate division CSSED10-310 bacterium]